MVDTGATFMCVTEGIASQLGFDITEAMDLVVDPRQRVLIVNPQHPNYLVALAK